MTSSSGSTPEGQDVGAELERRLASSKDGLLRQIGHLRQRVDYDYPPAAVKEDMQMVRIAYRSWRVAHEAHASFKLKEARIVPDPTPCTPDREGRP
jgi:hypothetical protein